MKENDGELVSKNDKFFSENLTVRFKNGKKFCGRLLTVWSISPRAGIEIGIVPLNRLYDNDI